MIDETNLKEEMEWVYDNYAKVTIANLQKKRINAQYVSTREEALAKALDLIPPEATIGRGDSITLDQIGLIEKLHEDNSRLFFDPFERDENGKYLVPGQGHWELMRKALSADIFLTGINAVTMDGKLVSIDSIGNRVAGMIFGPPKVLIVTGINKIVKNLDEAMDRLKYAAPINVKRHYIKHGFEGLDKLPCYKTGFCVDCSNPEQICSYIVIIRGQQGPKGSTDYLPRISVIIVGEELGI